MKPVILICVHALPGFTLSCLYKYRQKYPNPQRVRDVTQEKHQANLASVWQLWTLYNIHPYLFSGFVHQFSCKKLGSEGYLVPLP